MQTITLPKPREKSSTSIEEVLLRRRSVRGYSKEPLTPVEISQLLWAAQGITAKSWGGRTAPSAGALYPLEVYILIGNVEGIASGVYIYKSHSHTLHSIIEGDLRSQLSRAALSQEAIRDAAVSIIIAAVVDRTKVKYGNRAMQYVFMEAGHAAQNIYLQATAMHLGTVVIGAFYDNEVKSVLKMPEQETPLYIMPIGWI